MPLKSSKQYRLFQAASHGTLRGLGPPPGVAKEMISKTPSKLRNLFSKSLSKRRKGGNK